MTLASTESVPAEKVAALFGDVTPEDRLSVCDGRLLNDASSIFIFSIKKRPPLM